MQEKTLHAAFFTEANDEDHNKDINLGTLGEIFNEDDLGEGRRAIPAATAGRCGRDPCCMEAEKLRRSKWLKAPRATHLALRRVHNMTCHSSTASVFQLLRTACTSPEAIEACRHFACETCRIHQPQTGI